MKYSHKLMFMVLLLFGYGKEMAAYNYSVANLTPNNVEVGFFAVDPIGVIRPDKGGAWNSIPAFETRTFRFKKFKKGVCLSKIKAKFYTEVKIGLKEEIKRLELPVPIKLIDKELYDEMLVSLNDFSEAVGEFGKVAALMGEEGVALELIINGVTKTMRSIASMQKISFCRSRDFIFIMDYDPFFKINRIYGFTPPE